MYNVMLVFADFTQSDQLLLVHANYFQYATSTFPIMHLICPQILRNLCFSFLLGIKAIPREIENNSYAKFSWANKVHYGKCGNGVYVLQFFSNLNSPKKFTSPSGKLRTEFYSCPITKSTSPVLSDTTFFVMLE